jgi:hypothetical protein
LLLATWAENRGHWPVSWSTHPPFATSPILIRTQTELTPAQRQQLGDRTQHLTDTDAITLARTQIEAVMPA